MNDNFFNGWEDTSDEDFFSQVDATEENVDTTAEAVINEINKPEANTQEQEEEEDLFKVLDNENQETVEQEEEDEPETLVSSSISTLNFMKERGLIDFELEEGEELTEELAEDLLEDKYEETIEERIKEKLTDLPEDAKQIISYVLKGGTVTDFLKQTSSGNSLAENLDMSTEANQELVVRTLLEEEDEDLEFIDSQIELLKDSGKLASYSQKKYTKWKAERKEANDEVLRIQTEKAEKAKLAARESKREAQILLEKNTDIGGITLSKEDKKSIPSFMNDRTVSLNNGAEITEMQKELFYEVPKNPTALMQLAILLKNRNKDGTFNFDAISRKAETQVVSTIKNNIRRKAGIPSSSASKGNNSQSKSLASYFS